MSDENSVEKIEFARKFAHKQIDMAVNNKQNLYATWSTGKQSVELESGMIANTPSNKEVALVICSTAPISDADKKAIAQILEKYIE